MGLLAFGHWDIASEVLVGNEVEDSGNSNLSQEIESLSKLKKLMF